MASIQITGKVSLTPSNKSPLGLHIEIAEPLTNGFLGSGTIDANGIYDFTLYGESLVVGDVVVYNVYKGTSLILSFGTVIAPSYDFLIKDSIYDETIMDKTRMEYEMGFVIVKGSITLGGEFIPAIATVAKGAKVVLYKSLFRNQIELSTALIDEFGRYEFKLPFRKLFPDYVTPASAWQSLQSGNPEVELQVFDHSGTAIHNTKRFQLLSPSTDYDIHLDDPLHFEKFHYDFDWMTNVVVKISGLSKTLFYTIDFDTEQNEIKTIAALSGQNDTSISCLIHAYIIANKITASTEHIYALLRENSNDLAAIISLDLEEITTILTNAHLNHIIPEPTSIEATYNALSDEGTVLEGETEVDEGVTLFDLFQSITGDIVKTKIFLKICMTESDSLSLEDFWGEVEDKLGSVDTTKLQRGMQVIGITGLQPEMTAAIFEELEGNPLRTIASTWTESDWLDLVDQVCSAHDKLCVPSSLKNPDESDTSIKEKYATKLYDLSTSVCATAVIANRITSEVLNPETMENPEAVVSFIEDHTDFDFRKDNIWTYLVDNDIFNEELKGDIMPVQNIMRLTGGKPDAVVAMLNNGIRSSADILAMTKGEFMDTYKSVFADMLDHTGMVYDRAVESAKVTQSVYLDSLPVNYPTNTVKYVDYAVWGTASPGPAPGYPNLSSIFGSMDMCGCTDCTSLYSPAAYFTDILGFIKKRLAAAVYNELYRRRPDLVNIDLSCKNSHTPMPYVDLVNELLELIILKQIQAGGSIPGLTVPTSFQTSGTAKELAAFPEHTYKNSGVYTSYPQYRLVYDLRLNKAFYPIALPFSLPLVEARTYLDHLGYSRYQLMQLFKPTDYTTTTNVDLIAEYDALSELIRLSRMEADIICKNPNVDVPTNAWEFYGFTSAGTWYNTLCNDLDLILDRCNINYLEFLQLMVTDFLNKPSGSPADRPFAIMAKDGKPVDTCVVKDLILVCNLVPDVAPKQALFDKMHRFLRLQRTTGWSIYQLDIVLASFGYTDITKNALMDVARTYRLATTYKLAPERICSYWSNLNTTTHINFSEGSQNDMASQYEQLFQNKAISNPPPENFVDPFSLVGDYIENKSMILAACNLSEDELSMLLEYIDVLPTASLDLTVLSRLYAIGLLAPRLRFSIVQILQAANLFEIDGQITGTPQEQLLQLETLITEITTFNGFAFSLDETDYFICNKDPNLVFIPLNKEIQQFYETLRDELKNQVGENNMPDPSILRTIVVQAFSSNFSYEGSISKWLLEELISMDNGITYLMDNLILEEFILSDNDIIETNSISAYDFDNLYVAFWKINKIAKLISKYKLSVDELKTLEQHHEALDILSLDEVPSASVINPSTVLENLIRYDRWIRVRDSLNVRKPEFIDILRYSIGIDNEDNLANKEDWNEIIAMYANWQVEDIETLVGNNGTDGVLNVEFDNMNPQSNDFRNGKLLLTISDITSACKKIGLTPAFLHPSLLTSINSVNSLDIRQSTKAKYAEDAWLKIAKPLQDNLRRQQRKALTSYIISRPTIIPGNNMLWKNENDLYAYLLIDVEMEPCMLTSRIKQGISSLQLYMDRILLNIERVNGSATAINMNPDMAVQWRSWRKWYRVWEANRKVFFYPENWIEPELRDDKTDFFKAIEAKLNEDDVSDRLVSDAYMEYLKSLDEVARLEPVSCYHQIEQGKNVIHVFARTGNQPARYFYRRLENNEWSHWESMGTEIKSNIIAPLVWNGRLFVFWITGISKKPTKERLDEMKASNSSNKWINKIKSTGNITDKEDTAYKLWDFRLNWIQYKDGRWLAVESSDDVMELDFSKVEINSSDAGSYGSNMTVAEILKRLSKNGELGLDEIFKQRLYLVIKPFNAAHPDWRIFNVQFAAGIKDLEVGVGLHSFVWSGAPNEQPFVLRHYDAGHQVIAPKNTMFLNNKFLSDYRHNQRLYVDTYKPGYPGYFVYVKDYLDSIIKFRRDQSYTILNRALGDFWVTARGISGDFNSTYNAVHNPTLDNFFYEDFKNSFFVRKEPGSSVKYYEYTIEVAEAVSASPGKGFQLAMANYSTTSSSQKQNSNLSLTYSPNLYRFHTFYHAQINDFIKILNKDGISGLLQLSNQKQTNTMNFGGNYLPTNLVHSNYPKNNVQFDFTEAYSKYNWEIFFHVPMMIAQRLSENQKFEEAMKWYHYIFDPTSNRDINNAVNNSSRRFWKFYPFYEESGMQITTVQELVVQIANNVSQAVNQVNVWEANPFKPHVIARMRRLAYMKNVLMKYLDNLIAWGDQLFSRDTIESINEATQLYILAANLLGQRPRTIPPRVKKENKTFLELGPLDALSNAWVQIESFYTPNAGNVMAGGGVKPQDPADGRDVDEPGRQLLTLYFCLPGNDKLLGYWDTVADRLFKIRNCMNIEGLVRNLSLYEPPIDPALLVRATAMGIDITTILDDLTGVNAPIYRFTHYIQKAYEIANDVKGLGQALLSALEKKDAEALALLRSNQEIQLLEKVKLVRELQILEAEEALEALRLTKEITQVRYQYYSSRTMMNSLELAAMVEALMAGIHQGVQATLQGVASGLSVIPQFHGQAIAAIGTSFGGQQLSAIMNAVSAIAGVKAIMATTRANSMSTMAGYVRRFEDWQFQAESAQKELEQIDKQILGAEIRINIANRELANHELQTENAREADAYMRSKYTNIELYNWMVGQISATYFQSYQLAFEIAKKTEKCYHMELPIGKKPINGFIKFGYWDSLRKGLLSGDKLAFDLRKMEATYMDENKRELELKKNFSLAIYDPTALIKLKETGSCNFTLDKVWFDLDYPGHYLRKIKSVSISIPCVAGPYTTIAAQLLLTSQVIYKVDGNPLTPEHDFNLPEMIATSSAQNDSGLFELNFRDERYIPFENKGAADSQWELKMMENEGLRQFDFSTINDVIIHISYTARYDGAKETTTLADLEAQFNMAEGIELPRYFSLRHDFSNSWFTTFNNLIEVPGKGEIGRGFSLEVLRAQFPQYSKGKTITITKAHVFLKPEVKPGNDTDYMLIYGANPAEVIPLNAIGLDIDISTMKMEHDEESCNFNFVLYRDDNGVKNIVEDAELIDIFVVFEYELEIDD